MLVSFVAETRIAVVELVLDAAARRHTIGKMQTKIKKVYFDSLAISLAS